MKEIEFVEAQEPPEGWSPPQMGLGRSIWLHDHTMVVGLCLNCGQNDGYKDLYFIPCCDACHHEMVNKEEKYGPLPTSREGCR